MLQARSWLPRAEGTVRVGFGRRGAQTVLADLHQAGAARARFPSADAGIPTAVLLNTAGGLTGGDRLDVSVRMAAGAAATVTTAAAEKIYRARDEEPARMRVSLSLGAGACLAWLPQSTILFDRSRLERRTEVELAGDATFLAVECLVFGRAAMGEDVHRGACRDVWRIRRDGTLVFADALLLDGAIADTLDRRATLDGARASAMIVYVDREAPARVADARALLAAAGGSAGVSAWDGLLVARVLAPDGRMLLGHIAPLLERLHGRPLPRVWRC